MRRAGEDRDGQDEEEEEVDFGRLYCQEGGREEKVSRCLLSPKKEEEMEARKQKFVLKIRNDKNCGDEGKEGEERKKEDCCMNHRCGLESFLKRF